MNKFKCEAQVMITKEFNADNEDQAEKLMDELMSEEYPELDFVISVYEIEHNIKTECAYGIKGVSCGNPHECDGGFYHECKRKSEIEEE